MYKNIVLTYLVCKCIITFIQNTIMYITLHIMLPNELTLTT